MSQILEPPDQYPFTPRVPRRVILTGKKDHGILRAKLVTLQGMANRKREAFRSDCAGSPSETLNTPLLDRVRQARSLLVDESEIR